MTRLQWEKIPSVTPGGKRYFYLAWPEMNGRKRKYCVAWHRYAQRWVASFDDMQTCLIPEEYGLFDTAKDAQACLEADYQQYLAQKGV